MKCSICFEEITKEKITTLGCKHKLCTDCFVQMVKAAISEYSKPEVKCPELNCRRVQRENFVITVLGQRSEREILSQYKKAVSVFKLNTDKTLLVCVDSTCKNVMTVKNRDAKIFFSCEKCKTKFCGACRLKSHKRGICLVDSQDNLKDLWRDHKVVHCPSCSVPVEKVSGCNHMTCSFCKHQFCWLCGRHYYAGHFGGWNIIFGCPGMQNVSPQVARQKRVTAVAIFLLFILAGFGFIKLILYLWWIVSLLAKTLLACFIAGGLKVVFRKSLSPVSTVLIGLNAFYYAKNIFMIAVIGVLGILGIYAIGMLFYFGVAAISFGIKKVQMKKAKK